VAFYFLTHSPNTLIHMSNLGANFNIPLWFTIHLLSFTCEFR